MPLRHTREADRAARAERARRAAELERDAARGVRDLYRREVVRLEDAMLDAAAELRRMPRPPPGAVRARRLLERAARLPT